MLSKIEYTGLLMAAGGILLLFICLYYFLQKRNQAAAIQRTYVDAEEKAMRKIAGELHDNIAPTLLLLRLQLTQFQQQRENATLDDYTKSIDQVLDETSQLAGRLRASSLTKKGLVEATRDLLHAIKEYRKINTSLELDIRPLAVSKEKELLLFRIIQESVQNVVKHAQATLLVVRIGTKDDLLSVEIIDNGKGFNKANVVSGSGLGNMHERATALGGRLILTTKPGTGTTIHLQIPKS